MIEFTFNSSSFVNPQVYKIQDRESLPHALYSNYSMYSEIKRCYHIEVCQKNTITNSTGKIKKQNKAAITNSGLD